MESDISPQIQIPEADTLRKIIDDNMEEFELGPQDIAQTLDVESSTVYRNLNGEVESKYSMLQDIWKVIEKHKEAPQKPAKEVMITDVEWAFEGESRDAVMNKMTQNDYSQLPVKSEDTAIGWVTDLDLIEYPDSSTSVKEMMGWGVISVAPDDSVNLVQAILEEGYPAVLVEDGGEYTGLITSFDIFDLLK